MEHFRRFIFPVALPPAELIRQEHWDSGALGFRGGVKSVDGKAQPAFILYVNGEEKQGKETMGRELGAMLETQIPQFLVELGKTVAESGMSYTEWNEEDTTALERIAGKYLA